MGYRVAVLDPDPDCPAAAVADQLVIGSYDDVGAALRLAELSDVVTYELEHVAAAVVEAIEALEPAVPVRPGRGPLLVTQDRLAERRFVEAAGVAVAPWREVRSVADARSAADDARPAAPAQAADRRLRRPRPAPDRAGRRARRRLGAARPAAGLAAARRARARLRGGAVGRRRARGRWRGRDLPDRPERPRRRDPRRVGRAGARPGRCRRLRRRDRPCAGRGDGPVRHADRRAVPAARRVAGRQRARAAGPQLRPLDDRGRGDLAVRAAHPGDLRARARLDRRPRPDRDGQPARQRTAPRCPAARRRRGAGRPGRPPPPVRQASGLRTPQDGPPDRGRAGRRRGARARPAARWRD